MRYLRLIVAAGCVGFLAGCVVAPRPVVVARPAPVAEWIPGHYAPNGGWIPGHYRRV